MDKIKAVIIDDEYLARQIILNYLDNQEFIEIVAECENGFDALKTIQEMNPDLLFLDIQMPKINGFELVEVLDKKPEIIFITAFDQYAIKAFEMNAVDYLLKPYPKERFLQAIEKVKHRLASRSAAPDEKMTRLQETLDENPARIDRVITRMGSKIHVIPIDKIHYIESQDDYVMVYSETGNYLKEKTMKYFELHLPPQEFLRIHRSYIVNISQITAIELYGKDTHLAMLKCGAKLKVSAEGYKKLRERL
ncbi:MAG: LytTR family transcriptional regulator DNA-binding domain-containing protein [Bacteroidetes bacterium]|nr:LytTR family transcriptional regulator DNA-binding domain-containing protein [Bacteroidota bacterium]